MNSWNVCDSPAALATTVASPAWAPATGSGDAAWPLAPTRTVADGEPPKRTTPPGPEEVNVTGTPVAGWPPCVSATRSGAAKGRPACANWKLPLTIEKENDGVRRPSRGSRRGQSRRARPGEGRSVLAGMR
jgi:hypothetical protein